MNDYEKSISNIREVALALGDLLHSFYLNVGGDVLVFTKSLYVN